MTGHKLRIAQHNIRGLNHKINELKAYSIENKVDILIINESLKIKPNTSLFGYNISKPDTLKGQGVAIIYSNKLKIINLPEIIDNNTDNIQHSSLSQLMIKKYRYLPCTVHIRTLP